MHDSPSTMKGEIIYVEIRLISEGFDGFFRQRPAILVASGTIITIAAPNRNNNVFLEVSIDYSTGDAK